MCFKPVYLLSVCRLGYHRLQQLCTSLQIPKDLVGYIKNMLKYNVCIEFQAYTSATWRIGI